jgi:hypothetical protein
MTGHDPVEWAVTMPWNTQDGPPILDTIHFKLVKDGPKGIRMVFKAA